MLKSRKSETKYIISRNRGVAFGLYLGLAALAPGLASSVITAAQAAPMESAVTKRATTGEVVATEETSAVERALESKVREILDGVLKSDKYAVYVQVNMKPDAVTLQAYYDERSLQSLPGMPGPDTDAPSNNKLYSMIQSRKVIIVLDKSVTGDQELVTKEVLKAKLSINDKKGDTLDIRHSDVPASIDRAIASSTTPPAGTEAWVKNFLIALAGVLAMALGLLLWQISLLRERVNSRAKMSADLKVNSSQDINSSTSPSQNQNEGEEGEGQSNKPQRSREVRESDPISAVELKEKILALAVSQPKACSLVARKLISTREGMRKLAVACEAIGFEYTKQLFDTVSPAKWRTMGEYLRSNLTELSKAPVGPILLEIYTDMLAESMGWDPNQNADGPFDFMHKLNDVELSKMLAKEEPTHIAFIAAFWEAEEMAAVLSVLPDAKRKDTILQIARLRALPREVVQQAAVRFAERLKAMRARNEMDVDGSQVVARMLDTVDSTTEEELLRFIEREDPATRNRLRAHYFSFDSVNLVPSDLLASVLETFDPSVITQALVGASPEIVEAMLGVLPAKQRAIIEDDVNIANGQNTVPRSEASTARKQIVVELRKAMKDRGIELSHLGGGGAISVSTYSDPFGLAYGEGRTAGDTRYTGGTISESPTLATQVPAGGFDRPDVNEAAEPTTIAQTPEEVPVPITVVDDESNKAA
jgi:flagellar motor switch protein FliG